MKRFALLLPMALALGACNDLTASQTTGRAGDTVAIVSTLSLDAPAAGVEHHIIVDPQFFTILNCAALNADAMSNSAIFGGDAKVLALTSNYWTGVIDISSCQIQILPGTPAGHYVVRMQGAALSDPMGKRAKLAQHNGGIDVHA